MINRRNFTREFKLSIINQLESGKTPAELGREHNIHPVMICGWRRQYRKYPNIAFKGKGNAYTLEAKLAEKDRLIGGLYAENEFLKKVLAKLQQRLLENRKQKGRI